MRSAMAVFRWACAAVLACGALAALAGPPPATAPAPMVAAPGGPDAALAEALQDVSQGRLTTALARIDRLIAAYPTFRLAQLIRGDLLLAQAGPISGFGNVAEAPPDRLADLRDEAVVRLKAFRNRPPANYVPRYLLQMEPEQKYAVVVDTQSARLYLYQNDAGRPRYVADYYISHGKLGAEKFREGDKRTPIGVYYVTSSLPRQKLNDFYGSGAFPISYPNEWDRQQGRDGHGIWLHGTPSDTYSRPPRASDGCVVLTNPDLEALGGYLQIGITPVIISHNIEWLSLEDWAGERTALGKAVEAWRSDWESRDVKRYLSHYSSRFRNNEGGYDEWSRQKQLVAAGKSWIKVSLNHLSIFRNPGKQDMAVVSFEQDYRSNNLSNTLRKRQYWMKEGGRWKIVYEGFA